MLTNKTSTKILVVGGAGYIGSHMVLALQQAGFCPVVFDNLSKGHAHAVMEAEFVQGDICDTNLLQQVFAQHDFFAVMHFASFIEVAESVQFPAKYYQNNVAATLNLLAVMLQAQVRHFIFSSTAAVYGDPQAVPITESHPLHPINPYGRSKWMVEEILKDYAHTGALNYAILRYFNAAGADPAGRIGEQHQPESHLIPLVLQVASGERVALHVYGRDYPTPDGTCVRDFVHVMDICEAHVLALQALQQGKTALIYNVGTGHGYSVQQVIAAAMRVTQRPLAVIESARRAGDPAILVADATRIRQELGWQPRYADLDTIIQHAWAFVQHSSY